MKKILVLKLHHTTKERVMYLVAELLKNTDEKMKLKFCVSLRNVYIKASVNGHSTFMLLHRKMNVPDGSIFRVHVMTLQNKTKNLREK